MAKRRRQTINLKPLGAIALLAAAVAILFYIPPANIFVIVGYIILLTAGTFAVSTMFSKNKKTQTLLAFFTAAFLISNYFAGFNLLNTLLLLSFIIGIRLLIG